MLWDTYEDDAPHSIVHELTFFVKEADGSFSRHDEVHEERTYEVLTYDILLEQAGFKSFKLYADFEDKEPTETSTRWFLWHKSRENIMTITGIIAEFNPFHNGHKYLLDQAEGLKIVAMSGNFMQRGSLLSWISGTGPDGVGKRSGYGSGIALFSQCSGG